MKGRIALLLGGALVLAALGVTIGAYADRDDSAGGVLIGMLMLLGAMVLVVKAVPPRE
ncbi:MAG: hypothetical protein WD043_00025 [Gemmatimonadales bacterium]